MSKKKPVKSKPSSASTRSAMEDLDRIFHEKARLGILTTIIASLTPLNFNELKELCGLTDGNLNRHLKVLVDSKILAVEKSGRGRNTNSAYRLTAVGRKQFQQYLGALETILQQARSTSPAPHSRGNDGKLAPSSS